MQTFEQPSNNLNNPKQSNQEESKKKIAAKHSLRVQAVVKSSFRREEPEKEQIDNNENSTPNNPKDKEPLNTKSNPSGKNSKNQTIEGEKFSKKEAQGYEFYKEKVNIPNLADIFERDKESTQKKPEPKVVYTEDLENAVKKITFLEWGSKEKPIQPKERKFIFPENFLLDQNKITETKVMFRFF